MIQSKGTSYSLAYSETIIVKSNKQLYSISTVYIYREVSSSKKESHLKLTQRLSEEIRNNLKKLMYIFYNIFLVKNSEIWLRYPKPNNAEFKDKFFWLLIHSFLEIADIIKSRDPKNAEEGNIINKAYDRAFDVLTYLEKYGSEHGYVEIFENKINMERSILTAKNNYASVLHKNSI